MAAEKYILVHVRGSLRGNPIVIKVSAINAIQEEYEVIKGEYYSVIRFGNFCISVEENLKTVIAMIQEAESGGKT